MLMVVHTATLLLALVATWTSQIHGYLYTYKGYPSGCSDGTTEGMQDERHTEIAACSGMWHGHINNASDICAPGWRVCSHEDEPLLKTITWKDATTLTGCYAYNAAQDGGTCKPCIEDLEQDDLGGVGRGCPHQSFGQKSCITGGQIDVSCCMDTHFNRSCHYRPGLATGALCCKLPGTVPQILVEPRRMTHVTAGVTFVLSCQAMGTPTPTITWYRDGRVLSKSDTRLSAFDSGYLLISGAQPTDTGIYQCMASNVAGNTTVNAKVVVSDYPSGCADGTTDGLYAYEDIQACKGSWEGHVKRGRALCTKGWHVCSPKHAHLLKMLTWTDVSQLHGCYAYNAANTIGGCIRCHRGDLAGVGSQCGQVKRNEASCLAEGRIDAYKSSILGCNFKEDLTSGVLCCRKPQKSEIGWQRRAKCSPKCANGGVCVGPNRCRCTDKFKGAYCQNAICDVPCIPNSTCVAPGMCRCNPGYSGSKCKRKLLKCRKACRNGGRCKHGKCKCPLTHYGNACQHLVKWHPFMNRTE